MTTAEDILKSHKNKVPIIIHIPENSIINLDKIKYIVPIDITVQQFHCILNKNIKKNEKQSVIMFINNTLPVSSELIGSLYNQYKDKDGFLYITLRKENTFG